MADTREILEADPPRRLDVGKWQNQFMPELNSGGMSRRAMEIELADYDPCFGGKAMKFTISRQAEAEQGSGGWPKVLQVAS